MPGCCSQTAYIVARHRNLTLRETFHLTHFSEELTMAARKPKRAKAKVSQPKNLFINSAHQIWLAGLGALARAQSEGPKVFQSLVEEGERIQSRSRDAAQDALEHAMKGMRSTIDERIEGVRDRASETWDNIEKIFQSRVQKALRQLGVPTAADISALSRKVNDLTESVDNLARKRTASRGRAELRPVTLQRTASPSSPT
jgi:poly(hydroxyalkanoate) granule-associated protein